MADSPRKRRMPGMKRSRPRPGVTRAPESSREIEPATEPPNDAVELDDEGALALSDSSEVSTAIVPVSQGELAPRERIDLLQRYMAEVSRYPLLSREKELELARRYLKTGDPRIAYRLVTANLRLVVKIAWEYRRAAFDLLDLIQEGNVGLMQAVKKFDPERNVKLSSYAAWWIRAYIIRYVMDNWRLVKLGTTQAQRKMFFNLRKEQEKLAAQGYEPVPKLLAARLNVSEQDVVEMDQRLRGDELSLDAPSTEDQTATYASRLPAAVTPADEALAERQVSDAFRQQLARFAKDLEGKEKFIFEKRLVAEEPLKLQEVGAHFGFSRERARQIEARLIQKLKDHMRENLPGFEELSLTPRDE